MAESDPLGALREQIRSASEAAERLVREAERRRSQPAGRAPAATEAEADGVPPGKQVPAAGWEPARAQATSELQALAALASSLQELLPHELQEQVTALIRQLLVLLRALIDWAVVQIDGGVRGREHEVEDIPIG